MSRALLRRLREDGVLRPDFEEPPPALPVGDPAAAPPPPARPRSEAPPHLALLSLCNQGALDGGLSASLDVRPDELIGPLCGAVGGSARKLRVVDVRERPVFELRVAYGDLEEPWELEDLYALVHNFNDLLAGDPAARIVAVLGEWEDMLQLWCVKKAALPRLLRQDYFAPRNRHQLQALLESPRSPR